MKKFCRIICVTIMIFLIFTQEVDAKKVSDNGLEGNVFLLKLDPNEVRKINEAKKPEQAVRDKLAESGIYINEELFPNNSEVLNKDEFYAQSKITITKVNTDIYQIKIGDIIYIPDGMTTTFSFDYVKKMLDLPSEYDTEEKVEKYLEQKNTESFEFDAVLGIKAESGTDMGASVYNFRLAETFSNMNDDLVQNPPVPEDNVSDFEVQNLIANNDPTIVDTIADVVSGVVDRIIDVGNFFGDLVTGGLKKAFSGVIGRLQIWFLNVLRTIADGVQTMTNMLVTSNIKDISMFKLMYSLEDYNKAVDSIKSTLNNKKTNKSNKNENLTIKVEEPIEKDAKIPLMIVDSYNMAAGTVGAFDINFFKPNGRKKL